MLLSRQRCQTFLPRLCASPRPAVGRAPGYMPAHSPPEKRRVWSTHYTSLATTREKVVHVQQPFIHNYTHAHTRTHARMHTCTHASTHARTRQHNYVYIVQFYDLALERFGKIIACSPHCDRAQVGVQRAV